jgi:large subunit ribosomal protein L13
MGDFVIVINAEKIAVTGRKPEQKAYYSHSGYPGGIKTEILKDLLAKKPEEVVKKAVWGMIPKNTLGRAIYKKLKVYRGAEHPHAAQNPQEYRF